MTKVTMKAIDTLHISAVGPDNIAAGASFDVNETEAKQLEDRGLATRIGAAKADPAPTNKMAEPPANKAVLSATSVKVAPKAKK